MIGVIALKKIDVHIHTSMWEKAHIQPGSNLAENTLNLQTPGVA